MFDPESCAYLHTLACSRVTLSWPLRIAMREGLHLGTGRRVTGDNELTALC